MNHSLARQRLFSAIAGLTALALGGCTEAATLAGPSSAGPRFDLQDPGTVGKVTICAEGGAASFTASVTPSAGTLLGGGSFSVAAGDCVDAWTADPVILTGALTMSVTQTSGNFQSIEATAVPPIGLLWMTVDQGTKTVTWATNLEHGGAATFHQTPPPPPPQGGQGCTPGYWKQSQHFGSWTSPYVPTGAGATDFDAAFGVNAFNPNITLLAALGRNGGGVNALARHAAAALLNSVSSDVNYDLSSAEVIAIVQGAMATGNYESAKNRLAAFNEQGCPLGRAE